MVYNHRSGIAAFCLDGKVIILRKLEEVEIVFPLKKPLILNGQQQITMSFHVAYWTVLCTTPWRLHAGLSTLAVLLIHALPWCASLLSCGCRTAHIALSSVCSAITLQITSFNLTWKVNITVESSLFYLLQLIAWESIGSIASVSLCSSFSPPVVNGIPTHCLHRFLEATFH